MFFLTKKRVFIYRGAGCPLYLFVPKNKKDAATIPNAQTPKDNALLNKISTKTKSQGTKKYKTIE